MMTDPILLYFDIATKKDTNTVKPALFSISFLFLVILFSFPSVTLAGSWGEDKIVYVVSREMGHGGVEECVQKIMWRPGLSIVDAISWTHTDGDGLFVLLSHNSATIYTGRTLGDAKAMADPVFPGDVVVVGLVDRKRAEGLDKIPEVQRRLGMKWSEYKPWVLRKVPKAKPSP